MKVGDLVVRTYGEGQRPMALLVGWWNAAIVEIKWLGSNEIVQHSAEYLEVASAVNKNKPLGAHNYENRCCCKNETRVRYARFGVGDCRDRTRYSYMGYGALA